MKQVIFFTIACIFYLLNTSCTKEIVRTMYLHDTLTVVKPVGLVKADTIYSVDITSDTVIQVKHDTLFITKTYTDSVKIIDTVIVTKSAFGDYKGDSVKIYISSDSGLAIYSVEVADVTSLDPSSGYGSYYTAYPKPGDMYVTVPNYPLSVVFVDVRYAKPTSCYVDLAGFQYEHILTDHIPFTSEGLASFQYVLIQGIFSVKARNY
jgi:hypothetical protein